MSFVFDPAAVPSLPIEGTKDEYPVHRIFCVGRNYVAHAEEMGVKVDRESPFYFLVSAHHLALAEGSIPMAPRTENYHHEIELVVALGSGGRNIAQDAAFSHVFAYGIGLDMTRRDLQAASMGTSDHNVSKITSLAGIVGVGSGPLMFIYIPS